MEITHDELIHLQCQEKNQGSIKMPKKEGSNDQKLKDLYDKFQSPEFREELKTVIETKGGKDMEYVPWSNVMNRFFKACPNAEYKFHEYSIEAWDNEGKMVAKRTLPYTGDSKHGYFVATSITCYGVTRSMTSAIYGNNFFAVNLNPTSNQVHNAQMRCLCTVSYTHLTLPTPPYV